MTFVRMVFCVFISLIVLSPLLHADARTLFWRRKHRRSSLLITPHKKTEKDLLFPNETLSTSSSTRVVEKNISLGGDDF